MLSEVKKCADNNDIRGLHYIFVDCLDVDPTFEKYKEDFLYCKKLNNFFDSFEELTPLCQDKSEWDKSYWEQLKLDLMKNFSEIRFNHMVEVAKVVYFDKIERLKAERSQNVAETRSYINVDQNHESRKIDSSKEVNNFSELVAKSETSISEKNVNSKIDIQQQDLLAKKRNLEMQNKQIEEEQRKQRERIEAAKIAETSKQTRNDGGTLSKKMSGVTKVIIAIIVVIVVVVLIKVL